ncbi:hypothetical protein GQ54DRAFT_299195 [Martensiomyces pterosporus]|nr:hypothetical protein GQ54DRAFT_299195 [Martensiomyces pterosporus]
MPGVLLSCPKPPTTDTHTFKQVPRNSANTHHVDSTHHLDCQAAAAGAPMRTPLTSTTAESRLCSPHPGALLRACCWNSRAGCQIGAPLLLKAPVVAAAVFRWRVLL